MSHLDGMVTMDSGNMHLASLVACPVISVWGATHTLAGFYGWNQNPDDAVQIELDCRPCSIYGNKECHRGDYACLNEISPETLAQRIKRRFLV
jgi:ADP-heptose:LPS heptosyltransferase